MPSLEIDQLNQQLEIASQEVETGLTQGKLWVTTDIHELSALLQVAQQGAKLIQLSPSSSQGGLHGSLGRLQTMLPSPPRQKTPGAEL